MQTASTIRPVFQTRIAVERAAREISATFDARTGDLSDRAARERKAEIEINALRQRANMTDATRRRIARSVERALARFDAGLGSNVEITIRSVVR